MIVTRFMLNLRGLYFALDSDRTETTSRISFIIGNLGATVAPAPPAVPRPFRASVARARCDCLEGSELRIIEEARELEVESSEGDIVEVPREWYEDEEPVYARDPFGASLAMDAVEFARLPGCGMSPRTS